MKTIIHQIRFLFVLISPVMFHNFSIQAQDVIYLNEIQAANYSTIVDNDFKLFSDWVELYNPHDYEVEISGYYLTDDLQDPQKWQFPPNTFIPPLGYILVWCDDKNISLSEIHTNFKLSAGGEEVGLFDPGLNLVDSRDFGEQPDDISFGRKPDGENAWFYFAEPSPGDANLSQEYPNASQSNDVDFSHVSGFYNSAINLGLSSAGPGSEIRYTTDGSSPTQSSSLYSAPFAIDSTTIIKARSYTPGLLPGSIVSHSFFISEPTTLPVVSMIVNPEFLWDPEIGIYVDEDIELRKEWERKCTIEYFNDQHQHDFTSEADIRLFGNTAYFYPQKTLSVFPDPALEYPLFKSRSTEIYYSYLLRSSSDDWPYTMMRDALMHLVWNGLKVDYQAYTPSVMFINGSYWGIHNIREKINERFLETYHGVDPGNLDLVYMDLRDTSIVSLAGDLSDMNALLAFLQNNDLAINENYEYAKSKVDLDNYIDHIIAHIIFSNTSWHHNVKIWKSKDDGAVWQWLLYDFDRGMTPYYLDLYSVIRDIDTTDLFFSHFNQNPRFRNHFLGRFCGHMNSSFYESRLIHYIDSLKNRIAGEIPYHSLRWKDECDTLGNCGIQSYEEWLENINVLKNYSETAPDKIWHYIMEFFGIWETANLTIHNPDPEKGKIYVNGVEYKAGNSDWKYLKGIPLEVVAVPNTGKLFLEYSNVSYNDTLMLTLTGDTVLNVRFGDYCILPSVVSNDLVLSDPCDAYFTIGNLTVNAGVTLTVEEGTHIFVSEGDSIFINGSLIVNGSENLPVVFRSHDETSHWGCISATNAMLNIAYAGFLNAKSAIAINGGELYLDHSVVHFSPYFYGDIVAVHYAITTITNNTFYGPGDSGKTDVIDCDEIPCGLIAHNNIFGTTDDGIDIGTGSQDILISDNLIMNCYSMGISIGESTPADIQRNIIVNCLAGIQVHSGATALADHNTLYSNHVGVRCYHYENEPLSGGNAIVLNSILSESDSAVFSLVENSTISFDYSLSDTDTIQGTGNIIADPLFVAPDDFDFSLQELSPCINSGDPESPVDPDGTRTDMGAVFYDFSSVIIKNSYKDQLLIFPNPSTGTFIVFLPDSVETIQSIEITNAKGQRVYRKTINSQALKCIINDFNEPGLHIISVTSGNGKIYHGKLLHLIPRSSR